LAERVTNADGRVLDFLEPGSLESGTYRLSFETGAYFRSTQRPAFYPQVVVHFQIDDATQHYHVPLLLSPFGYSTYRGS
jgi:5-hydroxyisourate hydrolase